MARALAIVWSIWGDNRRLWLTIVCGTMACGAIYRGGARWLQRSDGLLSLSVLPAILSLILLMVLFNFTEHDRRKGFAGFPQRFFTLPVSTWLLVACPMTLGIASIVGLYVVWTCLVFEPVGISWPIQWPVMLLAAGMVFYQTILWSLSGFRLLRILVLSLMASGLVAVGFMPQLFGLWPVENLLTAGLLLLMALGYAAAVLAVESQRHGGGRGRNVWHQLADKVFAMVPRSQRAFSSPGSALFWLELRRNGWILPATVLLVLLMIMGPVSWLAGGGATITDWTALCMAILPLMLAIPVGKGVTRPDFWSLDLTISPLWKMRPVTAGQIVAAKIRAAMASVGVAWLLLLCLGSLWLWLAGDCRDLKIGFNIMASELYGRWTVVLLVILALVGAVLWTWNLMIAGIWAGMSGRGLIYGLSFTGSIAGFTAVVILLTWSVQTGGASERMNWMLSLLPWIPWILALCVGFKVWLAVLCFAKARERGLIAVRAIGLYVALWMMATACIAGMAWLLSPRVLWLRGILVLIAPLAMPLARVAAAPLMVSWNRHR